MVVPQVSAPTLGNVRPSFRGPKDATTDVAPDFGPDFTRTPEKDDAPEPPKTARAAKKADSGVGRIGLNKKARSAVPKLTREAPDGQLSDLDKLTRRYIALGKLAQNFHPKFSAAMDENAEDCANAWFDLAEQNDTVRRWIHGFLEGGAWSAVIAAHTPIFLAVIPEAVLMRFFFRVMSIFTGDRQESEATDDLFGGLP